jgi:hypothetical protein
MHPDRVALSEAWDLLKANFFIPLDPNGGGMLFRCGKAGQPVIVTATLMLLSADSPQQAALCGGLGHSASKHCCLRYVSERCLWMCVCLLSVQNTYAFLQV